MGGQEDDTVITVVLEHFPHLSPSSRVHTRGRFVKDDELAVPDKSDPCRQSSLLPSGEHLRLNMGLLCEIEVFDDFADLIRDLLGLHPLEGGK